MIHPKCSKLVAANLSHPSFPTIIFDEWSVRTVRFSDSRKVDNRKAPFFMRAEGQ
jgi:hypothetical protein